MRLSAVTMDGQTGVDVLCVRATVLGDIRMCMIVEDANKQNKRFILLVHPICKRNYTTHFPSEVKRWGQIMPFRQ